MIDLEHHRKVQESSSTTMQKINKIYPDKRRIIVGISGASCSGKTWFAKKFQSIRPHSICLFDLDSYYKDHSIVSRLEHQHDNPEAINFDDALNDLMQLKSGVMITAPTYNFELHKRDGVKECQPAPIIVVEGIFVFSDARFRKELDVKLWIDASDNRCYGRRMDRDIRERGRDAKEVETRYAKDVVPGFKKFIYPMRQHAGIIFQNNGNDYTEHPKILDMLMAYVENLMDI